MDSAPPEQTAPLPEPAAEWFAREVHPHESALRAYLRGSFPAVRDVDDVVHDSYLRILRQGAAAPIRSARAFLFTVARRLALDRLRSARRSPISPASDAAVLDIPDARTETAEAVDRRERVRLLVEAIDSLPARCRQVVVLRKLRLLSQREVAERLGISEKGVENQLSRGIGRCRAYFAKRGLEELFDHEG